jgi:hypothetical protein
MPFWRNTFAAVIVATALGAGLAEGGPASLLPKSGSVPGWVWQGEPRSYAPDNLYEYIDGAADLFLAYGFQEAAVADYQRAGDEGHWIIVEIYDMGAPLHAFGIYTAERPPHVKRFDAGAQAYQADGMVALWRGRYYAKVLLVQGNDAQAQRSLAALTGRLLPGSLEMPAELKRLPAEGRERGSERYTRVGALGHKFLTDAVSADYAVGKTKATLNIADLASPEKAAEALGKLRDFERRSGKNLADAAALGRGGFTARDSFYGELAAAQQGRFVVIAVSEKADRASVSDLVKRAAAGLEEKPNSPSTACTDEYCPVDPHLIKP